MELGNMIFGNSRGRFEVNRSLQEEFCELLETMGFDSYGHKEDCPEWAFENDVFRMQPYYWGDCTCGYEQREERWSSANDHQPDCYQSELKGRMAVWDIESGFKAIKARAFGSDRDDFTAGFNVTSESPMPGVQTMMMVPRNDEAMEAWRAAHDRRDKHKDGIQKELCGRYGLTYPSGCAVHCTCDFESRWRAWSAENRHASNCPIVTANFLFKPSGFRLDWYKYPLRDSYSSEKLTRRLMRSMLEACAASLRDSDTHPQGGDACGSVQG